MSRGKKCLLLRGPLLRRPVYLPQKLRVSLRYGTSPSLFHRVSTRYWIRRLTTRPETWSIRGPDTGYSLRVRDVGSDRGVPGRWTMVSLEGRSRSPFVTSVETECGVPEDPPVSGTSSTFSVSSLYGDGPSSLVPRENLSGSLGGGVGVGTVRARGVHGSRPGSKTPEYGGCGCRSGPRTTIPSVLYGLSPGLPLVDPRLPFLSPNIEYGWGKRKSWTRSLGSGVPKGVVPPPISSRFM